MPDAWAIGPATLRTIAVAVATVFATLAVSVPAAAALARLPRRAADGIVVFGAVVAVMPLVVHVAAWEATAGKFGWAWLVQSGASTTVRESFRSLSATAWVHAAHAAVLGGLIIRVADSVTPADACAAVEMSPVAAWWRVRLPRLRGAVAAAAVLNAGIAATEMTVADLYGCVTLADRFYLLYAAGGPWTAVAATSTPAILAAAAMIVVLRRHVGRWRSGDEYGLTLAPESRGDFGAWSWAAGFVAVTMLPVLVSPWVRVGLDSAGRYSFTRVAERLSRLPEFGDEIVWTLVLSVVVGTLAAAVAAAAMVAWPGGSRFRGGVLVIAALALVPGPLWGLAVSRCFQLPVPGFGTIYDRSVVPTVIAMFPRALAVAIAILFLGYRRRDRGVFETAAVELGFWRRWTTIDGPLLRPELVLAALAAGVAGAGDLAVTLPVVPPGVDTLPTRLFGLLHSGARYQESVLVIVYQTLTLAAVVSAWLMRRWVSGQRCRPGTLPK